MEQIQKKLQKGKTTEEIANDLEKDLLSIQKIIDELPK